VEAEAAQPRPRTSHVRLAFWAAFVAAIAAVNYASRLSESRGGGSKSVSHEDIYSYATFAGGTVVYAVWLGIVLVIVVDRFDLLALRRPQGWRRTIGLSAVVVVGILLWEGVVSALPLPESPWQEHGITNVPWEPKHAGAFAANLFLFAVIAPFVEELTFRGSGQSLLRFLGRWPSIVLVGVAFGLAHGLFEALLVLVPFGIGLAWLRDRTNSVVPGMFVHALFNASALVLIVVS
jgi:membrane protease YdiL (CAAX protease family)